MSKCATDIKEFDRWYIQAIGTSDEFTKELLLWRPESELEESQLGGDIHCSPRRSFHEFEIEF
jgi:hypothetical protein